MKKIKDTCIYDGCNCLASLQQILQEKKIVRPMLVCGRYMKTYASVQHLFTHPNMFVWFWDISENPCDMDIMEGVALFQKEGCDGVIALGGGSILDAGKCIAFLAMEGGNIHDFVHHKTHPKAITYRYPFIAIPTTAGTGSEMSFNAVITDTKKQKKVRIIDPCLRSDVVILDPCLTMQLSRTRLIEGAVDALAHALEAYTSRYIMEHNDETIQTYALQAISFLYDGLCRFADDEDNLTLRQQLQWGALYAGIAMEHDLNACHVLAGCLHQHCPKMHHATAVGIVLPAVLAFNKDVCSRQYQEITKMLSLQDELLKEIEKLLDKLQFPKLHDYLQDTSDLQNDIAQEHLYSIAKYNPKPYTKEDIQIIFANLSK